MLKSFGVEDRRNGFAWSAFRQMERAIDREDWEPARVRAVALLRTIAGEFGDSARQYAREASVGDLLGGSSELETLGNSQTHTASNQLAQWAKQVQSEADAIGALPNPDD